MLLAAVASACTRERPDWSEPPAFSLPTKVPTVPSSQAVSRTLPAASDAITSTASGENPAPPEETLPLVPPATELTPPPPTPTPEPPTFSYVVQPGDTLASLSRRFGVGLAALIELNELSDPDNLSVGQELRIPGVAPAGVGRGGTYVVKEGDTLFSIARQYGVTVDSLAQANNISDPSTLYVGQELVVPRATTSRSSGGTRIHVVQPGETLSEIAAQYGVSAEAIMQANGISDPNSILAGSQLIIP